MMSPRLKMTAMAVVLAGPLVACALERADLLPPADTYVRITQAETLWKEFGATCGEPLRTDPQVQDFIAAFGEKIGAKVKDGTFPTELRQLFEMHKILKGEITTVYSDKGKALDVGSIYLAASATEEDFHRVLERTAWLQTQANEAVVRKHESFQGTELVNDIMRGGCTNAMSYWMACVNGTLLLGSEREWVERNIVRLKKETIKEPDESKLSVRFPIGLWTRSALNSEKNTRGAKESVWSALGILDIEQYLLEIEIKDGDLIVDGTLSIADMSNGLFILLDTSPEDYSDDILIPAGATSFSYGKIDLPAFWKKLPEILGALPPKQRTGFIGLIAFFEQQSGLNIGNDILAYAGNRFTLNTEQINTNQAILISLELTNGRAMDESLTRLLASPFAQVWSDAVELTEFRGHNLYQLSSKKTDTEPPSLCIAGDRLLFGSRATLVRNAVLRLESDARSEPSIQQRTARKLAPENAFGYGGMNHRQARALIHINVSDSTFSAGVGFSSNPGDKKKEELGENEISLNHLTSFLDHTYHYAEAIPRGIHHRIIFKNEELKE
jgi:hypothetical protein